MLCLLREGICDYKDNFFNYALSMSSVYSDVYPPPIDGRTPLYFGLMFPQSMNSSCVLSAVKSEIDSVNDDPSLLSQYSLHYTLTYSKVGIVSYS